MNYAQTLDWLYRLEVSRGWDLKLESVREALARLGSPQQAFPALHVAGTNGKGSTAAFAHSVLAEHGLRVGLFTSPHLEDFRERIRIRGQWIAEDSVVALAAEIREALYGSAVELTFFELTTVMAFLHFARAAVDAAVIEVGLGGRLDATNVLVPRASVVTTIAFDHERYLGSTLAAIAAEKAGIFKPGVPAIVGRVGDEPRAVLESIAAERRSGLRRYEREFRAEPVRGGFDYVGRRTIRALRPGLAGAFQVDNAATAIAALEDGGWLGAIDDDTVRSGIQRVRWPGRLEIVRERPRVILDGAHNPAGVEALVRELPALAEGRRVHLVFGVLADKRWPEMAQRLGPAVTDAAVVPVRERRSEDPALVAEALRRFVPSRVEPDAASAVARWLLDSACREDVVLVAGSLFLVGEIRASLVGTTAAAQ
jgi:dihydrofolate synthase / folylpolyglutamate synthase